jgi:peptidoglycan/LPS O-acetylase OafA/YrhL
MRFKSIDSLRGLAASAVVFYHLWNRFYPGATSQNASFFIPHGIVGHIAFFAFGFGYLGVDLFFVVSGFCIHLPQALKFNKTGSDKLSIPKFAKRRFWRLYPAYFASLVWTSLVLLAFPTIIHLIHPAPFNVLKVGDARDFLTNALFLTQFRPEANYFNGVYWTLVYELQFYIAYPALLWLCRRLGFGTMFAALLALEIGMVIRPVPIPFFFLGRYYEWFLGMFLAEYIARGRKIDFPRIAFPLLLGLGIACTFFLPTWGYRDVVVSTACAVLLARCLAHDQELRWLTLPKVVAVGVCSYSLYLVHVPMVDIVWNGVRLIRGFVPAFPLWMVVLSIPASYGLAFLFFRYFEQPFLGEKKVSPEPVSSRAEQAW